MHILLAVASQYRIPTCDASANVVTTHMDKSYLNLCNNSIDFETDFWLIRSAT